MWNFITWVHLLAMAFFVGGQIFMVAAVVPVLKGKEEGEPMRAVARRFGYGTLVSLTISIATGSALATHENLWQNHQLSAKMGLVALVGVLILVHMKKPKLHALDGLIFIGSLAIVWLGVSLTSLTG